MHETVESCILTVPLCSCRECEGRLAGLPELLTVEEAARVIRVGRTKAYALTREWRATEGRSGLPVVDLGNVLRVPRRALEELIGAPLQSVEVGLAGDGGCGRDDTSHHAATAPPAAVEAPVEPDTAAGDPVRESRPSSRATHARRSASNQLDLFAPAPVVPSR